MKSKGADKMKMPDWVNEIPKWWNGLDQEYFEWIRQLEDDEKEEAKIMK